MRDYRWLQAYCLNRFGSEAALQALLPVPRTPEELRSTADDRYLSLLARRVFRAGLRHAMVDARWPAFEKAFFGFDPHKVLLMGDEHIERLMHDATLIRHLGKLRSVPRNARMLLELGVPAGGFGQLLADWPEQDIVSLWQLLARHGDQLGGLSAPGFLRMAGKDTFLPVKDVLAALKGMDVIDGPLTSKRNRQAAQAAFNHWQQQSGRPLCQLSAMLAFTVNQPV
ncbi:MAG: DNA-3-methyladenine glycosylase I [Halopseudomonas yangmingensis]